jgi:hypothetical protein
MSFITIGLVIIAISLHCSPKMNVTVSAQSLSEKLNTIKDNWQNMAPASDEGYRGAETGIPERGIRGRYFVAKSALGKKMVEEIVGENAFLSGPHADEIDYSSATSFGHYNPEFLKKLHQKLSATFDNPIFVKGFQSFYEEHLKMYLQTHYYSYNIGTSSPEIEKAYLAIIEEEAAKERKGYSEASFYLAEAFLGIPGLPAELYKGGTSYIDGGTNYDQYERYISYGFWVRRSIDGTSDEFYELLKLMLNTFDSAFLEAQQ